MLTGDSSISLHYVNLCHDSYIWQKHRCLTFSFPLCILLNFNDTLGLDKYFLFLRRNLGAYLNIFKVMQLVKY